MTSKKTKFTSALKSAAVFPVRAVSGGKLNPSSSNGNNNGNSSRRMRTQNMFDPAPGEVPITQLRVQIMGCKELLAKDKNGFSDPFVVVTLLNKRFQTPVVKKTLNPIFFPAESTFDIPIYLSVADRLGALEMVIWDKDMLKKDYLGEVALSLEDWFPQQSHQADPKAASAAYGFDNPANQAMTLKVQSTRSSTPATGTVRVKLGFVQPANAENLMDFHEIYGELIKRVQPSLVSAPPTEGVGTVRAHEGGANLEDDGGISSSDDSDDEYDDDNTPFSSGAITPVSGAEGEMLAQQAHHKAQGTTPTAATPTRKPPGRSASGLIPRIKFSRRATSDSTTSTLSEVGIAGGSEMGSGAATPVKAATPVAGVEKEKRKKFRKSSAARGKGYNLSPENDILGLVMVEVQGATDLPKWKNMTRTGFDMDPFVVISFGKKVFRTRVIRHSLNPTWDEKLIFHVRRYETAFNVQFSVLDWDKLSSNDHVGDSFFSLQELLEAAPKPDPETGLYAPSADGDHPMKEFNMNLTVDPAYSGKHQSVLRIRAKYQPYEALRQQFWRYYIKQYDTDDSATVSHLELTSMLDSLGSTLTRTTVNSFFTRYGKDPQTDEIDVDQAILALEAELKKPDAEKRRIDNPAEADADDSMAATPVLGVEQELNLDQLNFTGPSRLVNNQDEADSGVRPDAPSPYPTAPMQQPLQEVADGANSSSSLKVGPVQTSASRDHQVSYSSDENDLSGSQSESAMSGNEMVLGSSLTSSPGASALLNPVDPLNAPASATGTPGAAAAVVAQNQRRRGGRFRRRGKKNREDKTSSSTDSSGGTGGMADPFERVINVKNCPICHRPRLNSKAEVDIIQHIACCASQDWNKIDRIVVGNFVTASQAQRKWYTKIIGKISAGNYKLGANSANIIVQNRMTGQLEEEKMQVYVRLGIRLLYKGAKGRMEGARARRLLKSLSVKQGLKYDNPASAADIPSFIEYHKLNTAEIRDPLDSFTTFNKFFYRHLKQEARPVENPENPSRLVSAADCRLMSFETVDEATRLWIKGREFSVERLLGPTFKDEAHKFVGGALGIFRLAPQDYHRFHSPVDGKVGPVTLISGEYYTVNPQAIRTKLDVYGENVRKIVPIDSPQFGKVMAVCIGAMMVGSIVITANEGDELRRGDELGYFAFGGSTVVVLFEKDRVEWDEDLRINGKASLETLVRFGMGIGNAVTN